MNDFGIRLKQFRVAAKLSQREAAKRIEVSESTYRAWEYGNAIQGEPYPKIAKAFGITLDELFGITEIGVKERLNRIKSDIDFIQSKI